MSRQETRAKRELGIDEDERARRNRLIVDLNRDLAGLLDMAASYKQAHWNVVGPNFSALHALFDEFAVEVGRHADHVAERAVTLGGSAERTLQTAVERSVLSPIPTTARGEPDLLDALDARAEAMADDLRTVVADSADDLVTQSIQIDVLRTIEKQRWMLRAHLLEEQGTATEAGGRLEWAS